MFKRIITNPKLILIRIGGEYKLAFKSGDIYRGLVFDNAQSSVKKNVVITNPNFSIVDDNFLVNVNGKEIVIGHIGGGYGKVDFASNYIVANEFSVVMNNSGNAKVTANVNGKNIVVNGGDEPEPVYTNRLYYTVVEGGTQPTSTWITENCSDNVFDAETGEGYLVLNNGVAALDGEYIEEPEELKHTIFKDYSDEDWEDDNIKSIVIPSQITSIGEYAFDSCYGLTSITIPDSVTSIDNRAFDYTELTSIVINNGNNVYDSRNNCNAIIETATNMLIKGCKNTIIPNSVTSIGAGAFYGCSGLSAISIPDSVTEIEDSAFRGCNGLISATIGNSVTSIGYGAFAGCRSLTSITIPSGVTSIGSFVFSKDGSLASITCLATTPPTLDTNAFTSIDTTTCGVPADSITAYENSDWSSYFTTFEPIID